MQTKSILASALFAAVACAQNASLTDVLSGQPELANLTTFVTKFPDLVTALGSATNITILAPNNDAFSKLLDSLGGQAPPDDVVKALLTYHVLNGSYTSSQIMATPAFIPSLLTNTSYTNVTGGQVVELVKSGDTPTAFSGLLMNSTISGPVDVQFSGGYVHVIDTVLTVPVNISTTAAAANLTAAAGALVSANLVSAVDTTPDVTAFIPSNDAFAAIGSALPNLTMEQLSSILQYHVVAGAPVGYSSALSNTTLKTLQGNDVTISIIDGSVFVNSAKVIIPNVLVANGVVHVIDGVLNPDNTTATPNPGASTQSPAFPGASSASSLPFTTAAPSATATAGTGASGTGGAMTSSLSEAGAAGPFMPMKTGVVGAAALFGAGVALGL